MLPAAALALALAACSDEPDPPPGAVSAEEAAALNDAASMLDNQPLAAPGNQEVPPE